ncbi:MAG TPA: hypothetical protein VKB12_09095 [Pyrinomonadaceae bacterium]|nr:hypothetical protein [Pyrinomonadaceae bacterium]
MSVWTCLLLIGAAGAFGGVINALLTDNGFIFPRWESGVWCPGFITNVLVGAAAALISWAAYGSGASIDLAKETERAQVSLSLTAVAGACLVGVAGARWITNEVDKKLLKESVKEVADRHVSPEECERVIHAPARQVLRAVKQT